MVQLDGKNKALLIKLFISPSMYPCIVVGARARAPHELLIAPDMTCANQANVKLPSKAY